MNIKRFKRCNPDLDPTKYVEVGGGWAHKTAIIGAYASIGADAKVSANNIIYLGRAYKYTAAAYLDESLGLWTVQLGCYMRSVAAWDADFWNNPNEFPNDGSEKSNARLRAYRMLKAAIKASTVTS